MNSYRTHTCDELRPAHVDQVVTLVGWVDTVRDHGGVIFIDLRDRAGKTQVVFHPEIDANLAQQAEALRVEVGKRADEYILEHGDILSADSIEFDEICRNVWEDYCEGRIPDFPESIFDE